jgi:hypothetical protein
MSNDKGVTDTVSVTDTVNVTEGEFISAKESESEKAIKISEDYTRGLNDGINIGVQAGVSYAIQELNKILPSMIENAIRNAPDIKKAISDGARNGSSECAKALVNKYSHKKDSFPDSKNMLDAPKKDDGSFQKPH